MIRPAIAALAIPWLGLVPLPVPAADLPPPAVQAPPAARLTLQEAILTALVNNRDLQIERLGPDIAREASAGSYGYHDPILSLQARHENAADSGGFDPVDFSRDAIYDAESQVAGIDLTSRLPGGATVQLGGGYANSYGLRNGLNFDSYKLGLAASIRQPLLRDFWIDAERLSFARRLFRFNSCRQ